MVSESESFSDDTNPLSAPELFSQTELNDLVRDLGLSKKAAEVLASRLQEKHLLDDSAKVSHFRKRYQSFVTFFSEQKQFVCCHDIPGLLRQFGVASTPQLNGDCFWIALSRASNVFFYTMATFMEEFPLVTLCI